MYTTSTTNEGESNAKEIIILKNTGFRFVPEDLIKLDENKIKRFNEEKHENIWEIAMEGLYDKVISNRTYYSRTLDANVKVDIKYNIIRYDGWMDGTVYKVLSGEDTNKYCVLATTEKRINDNSYVNIEYQFYLNTEGENILFMNMFSSSEGR